MTERTKHVLAQQPQADDFRTDAATRDELAAEYAAGSRFPVRQAGVGFVTVSGGDPSFAWRGPTSEWDAAVANSRRVLVVALSGEPDVE
jgi:hypothetical protein